MLVVSGRASTGVLLVDWMLSRCKRTCESCYHISGPHLHSIATRICVSQWALELLW
jgi:hypothetical protein